MIRALKSFSTEIIYRLNDRSFAEDPFDAYLAISTSQRNEAADNVENINSIMRLLRRTPWWVAGHQRLGWLTLTINELELANASFEAVCKLSANPRSLRKAKLGLSKVYLAGGMPDRARGILSEIPENRLLKFAVKEQLVACYMAEDNYLLAKTSLAEIPRSERSPQLQIVSEYLEVKQK